MSSDNEQLQMETDKFRRLSTVDPLTQAYNRFGIGQIVATLMTFNKEKDEHQSSPDFASTFKRADTALYEAKAQGRNCCVMADDKLPL